MVGAVQLAAFAAVAFDFVGRAAAAPTNNTLPVCSSGQYSSLLPLSTDPAAVNYCSVSYPAAAPTATVLVTATSTAWWTTHWIKPQATQVVYVGGTTVSTSTITTTPVTTWTATTIGVNTAVTACPVAGLKDRRVSGNLLGRPTVTAPSTANSAASVASGKPAPVASVTNKLFNRLLASAPPVVSTACSCIAAPLPTATVTGTTTLVTVSYWATVTIGREPLTITRSVANNAAVTATAYVTATSTLVETLSTIDATGTSPCTGAAAQPTCALPAGINRGDRINPAAGSADLAKGAVPMAVVPGAVSTNTITAVKSATGFTDCVSQCMRDGNCEFATYFCGLQTNNCFFYSFLDCSLLVYNQPNALSAAMLEYGIGSCPA